MINLLSATFKYSGTIAIILFTAGAVSANTEYVFSAPPEVGNEEIEIPKKETDYPLYECNREVLESEEAESETKIDSHNCQCIDCEEANQNEESPELSNGNKQLTVK